MKINNQDIIKSIDDYIKGNLDERKTDELWVKLLEHPEYYDLLKTEAALKKNRDNKFLRDDIIKWKPGKKRKMTWAAGLAAVLVIGLLLGLIRLVFKPDDRPVLSEIPVRNLASPEIARSDANAMSDFDMALLQAFTYSVYGDTERAKEIYNELLQDNHSSSVLHYNLGILHYNTGDYRSSSSEFTRANCNDLSGRNLVASCYWFSANSLLAIGDIDRARHMAQKTVEMESSYQKEAFELLNRME